MSADQNPASLRHYNKAIRAVQKLVLASSKKSRQMILTCCLLFYAIKGIRGGFETGVKHLKSGLAILNESTAGSNFKMNVAEVPDVDEDIAGLLSSLDIVYSYMNNFSTPSLVLTTINEQIGKKRLVPTVFSNTREVQTVCTKLTNWAYHFVLAMIEDSSKAYEELPALMQQELRSLLLSHEQVEQAFFFHRLETGIYHKPRPSELICAKV
ncbi:hypothetical protein HYALB_00003076 [Hymenoscyphus albidus]|uniref:Uncharacterized protein n=1 Tax=Hymenoscyphus albidus TaxID=595503 RepID=A0A9N9LZU7_9HELO|nr:hypothetical protein HYALB_00003076 [Hymenoscyphus albidus]